MFKKNLDIIYIFNTGLPCFCAGKKYKETVLEETKQEIIENVDINNKLKKELKRNNHSYIWQNKTQTKFIQMF